MAIPTKSLDDMIREVKASLQAGEPPHPAYTLLVGSGFSFPIIPTPGEMLNGDIAWWRYCKARKIEGAFCRRAEGIGRGAAAETDVVEYERELWKGIHSWAATRPATAFSLTTAGLPDLNDPRATGRAYHAVMAHGLTSNKMRRQYLRDAIKRSYPHVNSAHIFLASILEAQERWEWPVPFCRTIFTTNFDPLLQRSLQLVNKLYYMSDRPDVLEPPDDGESDAIHLVYTHGSVHRYDLLNTEEQIEKARERNAPTLIDYFRRHGVIVIGYSGWADTTMEALASCPAFDSNLYWCDIHPAAEAESRLRPEALRVLQSREKNAFYVPIAGADEAMRLLHRELNLGPVPKFILTPVSTMIDQLMSIRVPSEPAVTAETEMTSPSPTLAALLSDTLTRLEVARSAFDDPSIVRPESAQGQEEVAKALVAQLLSDAYVAYTQGKAEQAIALWSAVANNENVPARDRSTALINRGFMRIHGGNVAEGLADYTAVIEMPDAPAANKARALLNRAIARGRTEARSEEIADYTTLIEMPDAPTEQRVAALYNRAVTFGRIGDSKKAIEDYTTVVEMHDASTRMKAGALYNRGLTFGMGGELTKEIDDYTTVIEMPDAPINVKAWALYNRGGVFGRCGESTKEIADYTTVIEMPDAPGEQKARALTNRGWSLFYDHGDVLSMVNDCRKALELRPDDFTARANLALGLLLTGDVEGARASYDLVLASKDAEAIREAVDDLAAEVQKRPDLSEALPILDRLRNAIAAAV